MPGKRNSREKRQERSRERAAAYYMFCERRQVVQETEVPNFDEEKRIVLYRPLVSPDNFRQQPIKESKKPWRESLSIIGGKALPNLSRLPWNLALFASPSKCESDSQPGYYVAFRHRRRCLNLSALIISKQSSTEISPFELIYARHAALSQDRAFPCPPPVDTETYEDRLAKVIR